MYRPCILQVAFPFSSPRSVDGWESHNFFYKIPQVAVFNPRRAAQSEKPKLSAAIIPRGEHLPSEKYGRREVVVINCSGNIGHGLRKVLPIEVVIGKREAQYNAMQEGEDDAERNCGRYNNMANEDNRTIECHLPNRGYMGSALVPPVFPVSIQHDEEASQALSRPQENDARCHSRQSDWEKRAARQQ